MGTQTSAMTITGTYGNLTFQKTRDGNRVRMKNYVSKEKIMNDKNFKRTRENMAEFGNAAKSGKVLRLPFETILKQSSDRRMISRLGGAMFRVLHSDTVSKRGLRAVVNGDPLLLADFEFNHEASLSTTFTIPFDIAYTRASGAVTLDVPSFIPEQGIAAPEGATHYKLQLAAAPVDFKTQQNTAAFAASAVLPWDEAATAPLSLSLSLPAASTLPVFIILQVQFFTQLNGDYYALSNGSFNACAIIKIDKP